MPVPGSQVPGEVKVRREVPLQVVAGGVVQVTMFCTQRSTPMQRPIEQPLGQVVSVGW